MTDAQDDRVTVGADGLSIGSQVTVVPPGSDRSEADASWADLHERYPSLTVSDRDRGKAGPETAPAIRYSRRLGAAWLR